MKAVARSTIESDVERAGVVPARRRGRAGSRLQALEEEVRILKDMTNNLVHGLVMFDANDTMIICNDRYLDMYGLSRETIRPGISLRDYLSLRRANGTLDDEVDAVIEEIHASVRRRERTEIYIETGDKRTFRVINQPLADGGWAVTHEDVTEQKRAEARISHMAHYDALTDLPNRVLFRAQLEQALRWVARDEQLALLFLDLDNFKGINDTLGHPVGDELLRIVADRLRGCIRETDAIARLGGDEFVIVQTRIEQPVDSAALAKRIREAIMVPFDILGHQIVVDVSIGIALSPGDATEAEQLIKNADLALYGAKSSGRGTYRFFEQAMDAEMMQRHALELDLRKALVKGELEIHYQALVNIERNRISCCEALLRWNHPERGMVSPDVFIPVAEETGLISRIGEWVLRTGCQEAATWAGDVTLSVNVSPAQFRNNNIVQVVAQALAASQLPPHRLEIEITEAILMEHTETALVILRQLRALGVKIAMDDFGTGYSSLSYLQKFPFDKIKIDQSFIQGLSDEMESSAIVRAVTGMAKSFRMATTAEGVETSKQLEIVTALGCTEMQGWLFAKACPAGEIAGLLAKANVGAFPRPES